jgi:hypothetical protein
LLQCSMSAKVQHSDTGSLTSLLLSLSFLVLFTVRQTRSSKKTPTPKIELQEGLEQSWRRSLPQSKRREKSAELQIDWLPIPRSTALHGRRRDGWAPGTGQGFRETAVSFPWPEEGENTNTTTPSLLLTAGHLSTQARGKVMSCTRARRGMKRAGTGHSSTSRHRSGRRLAATREVAVRSEPARNGSRRSFPATRARTARSTRGRGHSVQNA